MMVPLYMLSTLLLLAQSGGYREYSSADFRIRYERGLQQEDVRYIAKLLDKTYDRFQQEHNLSLNHRIDVLILNSAARMKAEAKIKIFDDAIFRNGKIFMVVSGPVRDIPDLEGMAARTVMSAMWEDQRTCPRWIIAAYSLYVGNSLSLFGPPAAADVSTFEDLSEEFLRARSESQMREVYSKLATAADYLVKRYGEKKFTDFLMEFKKSGITLEEALEAAFGEKKSEIEKGLVRAFHTNGAR